MSGYLVQVTPGQKLLYRTPWALRAAMHGGVITADSRIFHRATSSWVCITEHPEYRRYQAEISSPPWFDPSPVVEPEEAEDLEEPQEPRVIRRRAGLLRRLAGLGATLAKERAIAESYHHCVTGWAAIKKRFGSKGAKRPIPIRTLPSSAAPAPNQPNQAGPRAPAPPRDRWSFFS
jgi:hypothetical protein